MLGFGATKRRKRGGVRKKRNMKGVATDGNKSKPPTIEMDQGSVLVPSTIRFQYSNNATNFGSKYLFFVWTPSNIRVLEMSRVYGTNENGNIDAVWRATSIQDTDPPQSIRPGRLSVTIRNISTAQTCNGLVRVLISPNTFDWSPYAANGTPGSAKWGFSGVSNAVDIAFGKNPDVRTFTSQELYASKTFTTPILSKQAYSTFLNYNTCPNAMNAQTSDITAPGQNQDALPVSEWGWYNSNTIPLTSIPAQYRTFANAELVTRIANGTAILPQQNNMEALPVTLTRGQDLGAMGMIVIQLPQTGTSQLSQTYDFCVRSHDVCRYPLSSTMSSLHEKQNPANEKYMMSYVQGIDEHNMVT